MGLLPEDPVSVFLDAYRTGNSYSQVAPETHASRIGAESHDATLSGPGLNQFATSKGTYSCEESVLAGQVSDVSRQLALDAAYGGCTSTASKLFSTVAMNSCHYELGVENAGPPYVGTLGIVCAEGDAIEYKAFTKSGGSLLCKAKVGPQSGLEGLALLNSGEGAERGIDIAAEVKDVKYEYAGGCLVRLKRVPNGIIAGEATLIGMDESEDRRPPNGQLVPATDRSRNLRGDDRWLGAQCLHD